MSEAYDYDADNMVLNEDDDSDVEVEFVHPKIQQSEQKEKKTGGGSIDDDLFATDEASDGRSFMAVKPWLGAIVQPSNAPKNNPTAPDKQLRIEWIHGYRGFDSRSNAVYNARGHAVYPVAGVVVVYDIAARSQRHYMGHDDDVLCLSQHPTNLNLVASGQNATIIQGKGTPPHVCVWDTTDFTKTWILKGTQADRAFKSVAFSVDGRYLTTVSNDDNHSIKVWDWEKKQLVAEAKGDANPIYLVKWNHKDPTEFVTVGKRHCSFWRFDGKTIKQKKAQMGGKYPWQTFYAVAFSEKGYACVGGFDGSIYVFIGGKVAKVFKNIHAGKIFTIDWHPQGLVSGGTDGKTNILNTKLEVIKSFTFPHKVTTVYLHENRLLVGTQGSDLYHIEDINSTSDDEKSYEVITKGHWDGELWGLSISPDGRRYATVGEDNLISIWDITGHKLLARSSINEKKGKAPIVKKASTTSKHPPNQCARAIAWSPDGKHVIVGCNSGEVHVYRTDNLSKIHSDDLNRFGKRQVTGQTGNWIQEIKYSPNGNVCAVGTHGSVIVLLDVHDGYKPKGTLKAHNSFISHMDFSQDGEAMQSNCGAYELLFHHINENDLKSSAQVPNASAFKDTKWATLTCTFGWGVQGIFDPTQDGTDVNCVDVNASRTLAVTGDDYGNVNLFRYPVAAKGNKFHAYEGHSSHVVTTRFTPDEKRVISVGGHDLAITQWLVV